MIPNTDLTNEQRDVIAKVEKLMRLAGKNSNENEAAAAAAKAMELLAAYNLDMGAVERAGGDGGRRAEEKLLGGFYEYERDLWARVAQINFCWYWTQKTRVWRTKKAEAEYAALVAANEGKESWRARDVARHGKVFKSQHRLVGRVHNIAATKAMMEYLLGAIERLTRERLEGRCDPLAARSIKQQMNTQLWSRWAVSYREGIAYNLAEKLWDRREQQLKEELDARREAERRAAEAGMKGASTETGVTLFSLRKTEDDGNADFLYGAGWSARQAAARAEQARLRAEADAAYTAWAAAHPEEAAKKEREQEKEVAKRSARSYRPAQEKARDWSAFRAGHAAGDAIGLDPQAAARKTAGLL